MKTQHEMPKELLDAFDELYEAQRRFIQIKRRNGAKPNEVALAKRDRDSARTKFDDLLEKVDSDA